MLAASQCIGAALRRIKAEPLVAATIVLTLACGIGASAAIFSFANALLLRPFPFREPDRLVQVFGYTGGERSRLSIQEVSDLNQRTKLFEGFAAHRDSAYNYGGDGGPAEHLLITRSTRNLFDVLGVMPMLGSAWDPVEDRSRAFSIVLGHDLWRRRFNSDPGIVGKQVLMDGFPNTVVGVAPPGLDFPSRSALFRCWGIDRDPNTYTQRDRRTALVVARLKPNVTLEQARAELQAISTQLASEHPSTNQNVRFDLTPLRDAYVGGVRPYLLLLITAVGFVLLIACVNVANLLLAKMSHREREFSIRAALGASRGVLIRQVLAETVLLSALGGILGLCLALALVPALTRVVQAELPVWMHVEVDANVVAFLVLISLATGALAGLLPAVQASRKDVNEVLKQGARGSSRRLAIQPTLIAAEVAFAFVLLIGSLLLIQTLMQLESVNVGFDSRNLLTFHVGLSWRKYNLERARGFHEAVLAKLKKLPGVTDAALSTNIPLAGGSTFVPITLEGQAETQSSANPMVSFQQVSPDYHEVTRIPLVRGRFLNEFDRETSPMAALVSQNLAERLRRGADPLGKRILPADVLRPWHPQWLTVVGVVGDVKRESPAVEAALELYVSYRRVGTQVADFVARTSVDPLSLATAAARAVAEVDREEPVSDLTSMDQVIARTIWQRRTAGTVIAILAGIALLLAVIGIYGVVAYNVSQRTREMGIRAAVGATSAANGLLVLRQGASMILSGIIAGSVLSIAAARSMQSMLFGVAPVDLCSYALAITILTLVAFAACYIPARKASSIDPVIALRKE